MLTKFVNIPDWGYFYYSIRNSLVTLLEALYAVVESVCMLESFFLNIWDVSVLSFILFETKK